MSASYTLREALAAFGRAPVLVGLSAAMIAMSLFVLGLFGLTAYNIRRAIQRVEARVEVQAYLRDEARPEEVRLAQEEIARFPQVREVRYISRTEALDRAQQELPEFSSLFGDLEANPLPASLEVALRPGQSGPEAVRSIAGRIESFPVVEDVQYGTDWLDKIFLLRRIAGLAAGVLGVAFAAVAALIIGTAVRLAVFARRQEIQIMQMVGATNGFIQRPFLIEGFLTGLLGSALALLLTFAVFRVLSSAVIPLEWLPAGWILAGSAGGALLGMLASGIAVRRHLRTI